MINAFRFLVRQNGLMAFRYLPIDFLSVVSLSPQKNKIYSFNILFNLQSCDLNEPHLHHLRSLEFEIEIANEKKKKKMIGNSHTEQVDD